MKKKTADKSKKKNAFKTITLADLKKIQGGNVGRPTKTVYYGPNGYQTGVSETN